MRSFSVVLAASAALVVGCGGTGGVPGIGGAESDVSYGSIVGRGVVTGKTVTTNSEQWSALGFTGSFSDLRWKGTDTSIENLRILASLGTTSTGKLAYLNMNGSNAQFISSANLDLTPAISPDGKFVTYCNFTVGPPNTARLKKMYANGSGVTNLTSPPSDRIDAWPSYNLAGNELVFVRFKNDYTTYELRRVNASSGSTTSAIATDADRIVNPNYTRDGGSVYYCAKAGGTEYAAFKVSIAGGAAIPFYSIAGQNVIGVVDAPTGNGQVALVDRAGGGIEVRNIGYSTQPLFTSATGSAVYIVAVPNTPYVAIQLSESGGPSQIVVINCDTGYWMKVTNTTMYQEGFAIAPPLAERVLAGSGGLFGATLNGLIASRNEAQIGTLVGFRAVTPSTIELSALSGDNTTGPNLDFELKADSINYLAHLDADMLAAKVAVGSSPATANGAFISIGARSGKVSAILPYTGTRSAKAYRREGTDSVFEGEFTGVYTAEGKNLAESGARVVRVDANGKVVVGH